MATFTVNSKKSGSPYYLHSRLTANGKTKLYFFAKNEREGAESDIPSGYEVTELPTGLPVLKKSA